MSESELAAMRARPISDFTLISLFKFSLPGNVSPYESMRFAPPNNCSIHDVFEFRKEFDVKIGRDHDEDFFAGVAAAETEIAAGDAVLDARAAIDGIRPNYIGLRWVVHLAFLLFSAFMPVPAKPVNSEGGAE